MKPLAEVIEGQILDGAVVGAQLLVGTRTHVVLERSFGYAAPDAPRPVDSDMRFCIGSGSKPIAAACLMAMADAGELDLESPISKWLPEFSGLRTADGSRGDGAPTLRELLAHGSGWSSRMAGLTEGHAGLMGDLSKRWQSMAMIGRAPRIAKPEEKSAYMDDPYLVAGRAAEVATGESFETLLQRKICTPLGMKHTTFFPDEDAWVAIGGARRDRETMDRGAPHLAPNPLHLALVGGGMYSSATDLGRFCQMVLGRGQVDQRVVLEEPTWRMFTSRAFEDQAHGFGWQVGRDTERMTQRLVHAGTLSAYRSLMLIDMESAAFVVAVWTLPNPEGDSEAVDLSQELEETWLAITNPRSD